MSVAQRRDTPPEVALRREPQTRGMRYRVVIPVPGQRRRTIDLAITRAKDAVFVDGCLFARLAEHGTMPRSNGDLRKIELAAPAARPRPLREIGWTVVRVWEHESAHVASDRLS